MASLNRVQLIGHMGADPETRFMPSGDAIANISIATTEKWKDKASGEQKEETTWHRVSFFGRLAEIAGQYLKKGSLVYIEGSMRTRKYQDKETGQDRYSTDIKGSSLQMLDKRSDGDERPAESNNYTPRKAPTTSFDEMSDDIPF